MRYLIVFLSILIYTNAIADNCPSIEAIKNNRAKNWVAHDSENNKTLSTLRETKLRNDIQQFAIAEWAKTNNKNSIHCYYKNNDGSTMEAYFSKENTAIIKPSKYWYQVSGMMHCAAGSKNCEFQTLSGNQHQLAQN